MIPACGTVTISPACKRILFVAFPDSINSFKFTVTVFDSAGASFGMGASCAPPVGNPAVGAAGGTVPLLATDSAGLGVTAGGTATAPPSGVVSFWPLGGITSSLLIAGGCA